MARDYLDAGLFVRNSPVIIRECRDSRRATYDPDNKQDKRITGCRLYPTVYWHAAKGLAVRLPGSG